MTNDDKVKDLLLKTAALRYPEGTKFLNAYYKHPIEYNTEKIDPEDEIRPHIIHRDENFIIFTHSTYKNGEFGIGCSGGGLVYFRGYWADKVDKNGNVIETYNEGYITALQKAQKVIYKED